MPYMSDNQEIYDVNIKAKFADNSIFSQSAVILNKRGDNKEPLAGATFSFRAKFIIIIPKVFQIIPKRVQMLKAIIIGSLTVRI